MLLSKQKKSQVSKGNRILISINFLGSAGPMRFVVYEGAGSDALSLWEAIGAHGGRNFMMCKKPQPAKDSGASTPSEEAVSPRPVSKKRRGKLKSWINKSLTFKIASH